jgi:hypothetical protein
MATQIPLSFSRLDGSHKMQSIIQPTPTPSPFDLLSTPLWQGVTGIVEITALALGFVLLLLELRRRSVVWELVSMSLETDVGNRLQGIVQVLYDGEPVEEVYRIVLRFVNAGRKEIVRSDYERPLSVSFEGNGRLKRATVIETNRMSLPKKEVQTAIEGNKFLLDPLLLNEGDAITIEFFVSEWDGDFHVDGRIAGVKEIEGRSAGETNLTLPRIVIGLILLNTGAYLNFAIDMAWLSLVLLVLAIIIGFPFWKETLTRSTSKQLMFIKRAELKALQREVRKSAPSKVVHKNSMVTPDQSNSEPS